MSHAVEFVLANLCRVLGHPRACGLLWKVPIVSDIYLWSVERNYP